jgi:hypothetical protein
MTPVELIKLQRRDAEEVDADDRRAIVLEAVC